MIKITLFIIFIYLLIAYLLRWFLVSNSPEFFKEYGERTLFSGFIDRFFSALSLFLKEYCSYILAIILLIADYLYHWLVLPFMPTKSSGPVPDEKHPVLLIHGYMMRGWVLIYIKKLLQRNGWKQVYTWSYMPPFKNIPYYSRKLKEKVDIIQQETKKDKIILIGHSMGGLLARYYITNLQGKPNVEKLVTIGTPHKGTNLWSFTCSPCGTDMRPGSYFLKKLKELPASIKALSIYSSLDEIVLPYQSSHLNGKNIVNKEFDNLGHMGLIFSRKVYEEIHLFLLD